MLFLLSPAAFADVLLTLPRIANRETRYVEVGASPKIILRYRNAYTYSVWLSAAEINLRYDPTVIDNVIAIDNGLRENFRETEIDISTPGEIRYRIETPISNWRPIKVDPGQSIELAAFTVHVNQGASPRWLNLLTWSSTVPCRISFKTSEITGSHAPITSISLLTSKVPAFSGLNRVSSSNSIGRTNIGNTLLLDWRTAGGGASDFTRYFNYKLSYRVRRSESSSFGPGAVDLPIEEPSHDIGDDPVRRAPYTGNVSGSDYLYQDGPGTGIPSDSDPLSDGTTYWYQVTAIDDTSPTPNENTAVTILDATPLDLTPPEEVRGLTARSEDRKITLSWENPTDADLGGVVIMRKERSAVGAGSLGLAQAAPPYNHGPEYAAGDEPFGPDNGRIIYVSIPEENPIEYEDYEVENGNLYYYKVFTYDRAVDGPPKEMGRNYSAGAAISKAAGIPPQPISNFVATRGTIAGEVIFSWNNSESDFCEGVLIRYTTDDRLRYAALRDERSGEIAGWFPALAGPGAVESNSISLLPGRNYYFKAFAYNRTAEEFDPTNAENMARHLFSSGQVAAVALPQEAYEDVFAYTYNFQRGINHFAVPFPAVWMVDDAGSTVDISTWAKLIDELNRQAGENVVLTFGRWNEVTQKAEGIVSIDYTKTGMDRFSATSGVTPDTPVIQGGAYEISVAAPFSFTMRAVRPAIR